MARVATWNVSLPPELEDFVSSQVDSGRFASVGDAVREGLRLLQTREQLRDTELQDLRNRIAQGLASLDRGEGLDGEEVFEEALLGLEATS